MGIYTDRPVDRGLAERLNTHTQSHIEAIHARAKSAPCATAIIHSSKLFSDCLARSIANETQSPVVTYPSAEAWRASPDRSASLLLICTSSLSREAEDAELEALLSEVDSDIPIVVVSDRTSPDHILNVISRGARGYIPTSLVLNIAIEALRLVRAGGVFIPADIVMDMQNSARKLSTAPEPSFAAFTPKQAAVIERIRKGKPNKTIAYELNMCESTVKVHVRNIMNKLSVRNRAQIAFLANQLLEKHAD